MQWDLTRLYHGFSDPNFEADFEKAQQLTAALGEKFARPKADDMEQLKDLINAFNELEGLVNRLRAMISLTLATEAQNEEANAANDRLQAFMVYVRQCHSAFARYVGSLHHLDELIEKDPLLKEHAFVLRENAQEAKHTLDPALEETVLKLRITGSGAWSQLRGTLESTMNVPYEENGVLKNLPLPAARNLAYSPDAVTPQRAYEAELAADPSIVVPLAACLSGM